MNIKDQIESHFGLSVDQQLSDLSDIKTPQDFADYITLCVEELCDELINDVFDTEVFINIYARDALFNAINCLKSLNLNQCAYIETLKVQQRFINLRKHTEVKLTHRSCSDAKCISRIKHVQRSIQKAYLNMKEFQSEQKPVSKAA